MTTSYRLLVQGQIQKNGFFISLLSKIFNSPNLFNKYNCITVIGQADLMSDVFAFPDREDRLILLTDR